VGSPSPGGGQVNFSVESYVLRVFVATALGIVVVWSLLFHCCACSSAAAAAESCPTVADVDAWRACGASCGGVVVGIEADAPGCAPTVPLGLSKAQATAADVAKATACVRACLGGGVP